MSNPVSKFVWYDVMTTDMDAAEKFYSAVIGWTIRDSGMPGARYTLLMDGDRMIGGIMPIPPDAAAQGVQPAWMGYVGVTDLDAKAKELSAAGGTVHRQPTEIPGVGRFAVVSDPHGAGFIIFQPNAGQQAELAPFMTPKTIGWHELHGGDREADFAFYSKLFGWTKVEDNDMGPFVYTTFATGGDMAVGGMMTKMQESPVPHWTYYISVADFDDALQRVVDNGGTQIMDPMQVPGGMWICPCTDPQGAHFSLIGSRD